MRRVQRAYVSWQRFFMRWILVFILALLALLLCLLIFSPIVQVREMSIKRTDERLDIEQVQRTLAPLFGRHLLFLSEFEVLSLLQAEIPDLDTVEVQKLYPSQLIVNISLDPFIARLDIRAPDEPASGTGADAMFDFLTTEGVYISVPTPLEDEQNLPRVVLVDWGVRPVPGDFLMPLSLLEHMNSTEQQLLKQFGHVSLERTVFMRAQEYHLQLEKYQLWFDVRSSVDEQLGRYKTFLEATGPDGVTEYIDLRLKDQVVSK